MLLSFEMPPSLRRPLPLVSQPHPPRLLPLLLHKATAVHLLPQQTEPVLYPSSVSLGAAAAEVVVLHSASQCHPLADGRMVRLVPPASADEKGKHGLYLLHLD